ncbi:GAF domain-containing protein [Sphingomonas sp. RHCKR47]|uniref:GAF domain-containing protein n=1 Tax=Sphingomonas citricola TaxID=2862498 RepID=UPI001C68232A|nr:GAF domain-containing protein [Sphingomonas citricola]MBW6521998.1 GAF domain-containing protein [Sphingomonas citricola]
MNDFNEQERARLASLFRLNVVDQPPNALLNELAEVAALALDCPIAIISLVGKDQIWLKASPGITGIDRLARDEGLCGSAVMQDDPWVVENAAIDVRTLTNPLVAGDFGLRFYAGVPLKGSDGHNLGMLAAIDAAPRTVSERELLILTKLAEVVVQLIERRLEERLLAPITSDA